jgi:hypothetical protein
VLEHLVVCLYRQTLRGKVFLNFDQYFL